MAQVVLRVDPDVARICSDVTEGSSLATGEPEDDYFRVDRIEYFLGLRRLCQNQFPQGQRQCETPGEQSPRRSRSCGLGFRTNVDFM